MARDPRRKKGECLDRPKLSEADWGLLGAPNAQTQRDCELGQLRNGREDFLADALHQTSNGMIQEAIETGAKSCSSARTSCGGPGADMGSIQNRRFHRLSQARLVEQAMDKAEAASILCVEESYASLTIFAEMELLAAFGKVKLLPEKLKPSTSIQASF